MVVSRVTRYNKGCTARNHADGQASDGLPVLLWGALTTFFRHSPALIEQIGGELADNLANSRARRLVQCVLNLLGIHPMEERQV